MTKASAELHFPEAIAAAPIHLSLSLSLAQVAGELGVVAAAGSLRLNLQERLSAALVGVFLLLLLRLGGGSAEE